MYSALVGVSDAFHGHITMEQGVPPQHSPDRLQGGVWNTEAKDKETCSWRSAQSLPICHPITRAGALL